MEEQKKLGRSKRRSIDSRESILRSENVHPKHKKQAISMLASLETAPHSAGRNCLIRYLNGAILSRKDSQLAKCCLCCGFYFDGLKDCEIITCPEYPYMPYGSMRGK